MSKVNLRQLEGCYQLRSRNGVLVDLYRLFLASAVLVARKRYCDRTVRALALCVGRVASQDAQMGAARGDLAKPSAQVADLEQAFHDGMSEREGIERMVFRLAAVLVVLRQIDERGLSARAMATRLTLLVFGGSLCESFHDEDREALAVEVAQFLLQPTVGNIDALDYLFETHPIQSLLERRPEIGEKLATAAPLSILCELPKPPPHEPLASGYRIEYYVFQNTTAGRRILDRGAEVHIAPDGPIQAIRRVYRHLRHRWYPIASAINVWRVEMLEPSHFPDLQRHYTVMAKGTMRQVYSLFVAGRTREQALESWKGRSYGFDGDVDLPERPLYLRGRKPRPPLRLEEFGFSPESDTSKRRSMSRRRAP